jgi:hypothetical protein
MTREEFEALRDLTQKRIAEEIRLTPKRRHSPVLASGRVAIENARDISAQLNIEYNTETNSKTVNVSVAGVGPICRLEVDARAHRPLGRSHKHALQTEQCPQPQENLRRDMTDMSHLSAMDIHDVFAEFCRMAHIEFSGQLHLEYL